ncbi:MAG: PA0069 family radical SAM protein [Deltaproteobacteria bacterium]|nr:PA0069 family radical SAM protein [Myxococcales bacterium]MDP3213792.1 PA0069 family radical SAM protein [Deltaproteobacteria bacterium]
MRPVDNPPNPWSSTSVEYFEDVPPARLELFEERARSIVSGNDSPDIPFRWSVNPYRGCIHGCAYCYARPSHQYLGFGAGTDFDRKIVVKTNAPELLREAFEKKSWDGGTISFSGNTDCYQPIEATYELTRRCLELCLEYRNPVAVITKSALVQRDAALLAALAKVTTVRVFVSLAFADEAHARAVEPWASSVARRLASLRVLTDAGVTCGVAVAPIIPGLNDDQAARVLALAHEHGARRAFMQMLRLPAEVRPVFEERIAEAFPDRAKRIDHAIVELRGGRKNDPRFGSRMRGNGPRWDAITALFEAQCRRLGMNEQVVGSDEDGTAGTFRRPTRQGSLFGD